LRHNFISSLAEEQSNGLAVLAKLDDQAVRSLDCGDFDMIFLDVASSEIVDV